MTLPQYEEAVASAGFSENPEKALVKAIAGISPVMASEIVFRAEQNRGDLLQDTYSELSQITALAASAEQSRSSISMIRSSG